MNGIGTITAMPDRTSVIAVLPPVERVAHVGLGRALRLEQVRLDLVDQLPAAPPRQAVSTRPSRRSREMTGAMRR